MSWQPNKRWQNNLSNIINNCHQNMTLLIELITLQFFHENMKHLYVTCSSENSGTVWNVSKYGVFSGPYSVRMQENTDQKKLRIWTLFTQCAGKVIQPTSNITCLTDLHIRWMEISIVYSWFHNGIIYTCTKYLINCFEGNVKTMAQKIITCYKK